MHLSSGRSSGIGSGLVTRRGFLTTALGSGFLLNAWKPIWAAKKHADALHGPIKVTDIEVHNITEEFVDWIAYELNHFYGPWKRTVYVVHTDAGLTGLGESGSPETEETIEKYIGTSPFDWVGDETSLGLGTAMYDLMGQAAGVPVYKLFGQRYRRWVPVASWTVSTHPKRMAQAVQRFSAMGYTWMKYHLSPFENVMDQMEAMQAVAPEGFRIHHDITMHGTNDHMFELLEKISKYRIAGCFEDPLNERDIEGYAELRKRCRLPIIYHHTPLGATFEVLRRAADAYMLGHHKIGAARRRAGLFAAANIPFMLQNVGGNITRAMTAHMQSAFKTASFHFVNTSESKKSDVVHERIDPVNGFVRVPEQTRTGGDPGSSGAGAAGKAATARAGQVDHQDPLRQRHPHVQHPRSQAVSVHGAARSLASDLHELRLPPHHRVLGRRRLRRVPEDVHPDRKRRRRAAGAVRVVQGAPPGALAATLRRQSRPTAPRSGQTGRPPGYVLSVFREWHWVPERVINWPPTRLKG